VKSTSRGHLGTQGQPDAISNEAQNAQALHATIEGIYDTQEGSEEVEDFERRHEIRSLGILTVLNAHEAEVEVVRMAPWITGKRVVEIGAGVGLLAVALARVARSVVAIEVDLAWSWTFVEHLYRAKPPNLTWVFGRAEEVAGWLRADVAIVYTRSDVEGMRTLAGKFAPLVLSPLTHPLPPVPGPAPAHAPPRSSRSR
jgi:hypothetical protein